MIELESSYTFIFSTLISFLVFFLGIFVYTSNPKKIINLTFFGLTATIVGWAASIIFVFNIHNEVISFLSARLAFAFSTWVAFFLYYFTYHFPMKNKNYHPPLRWILVGTITVFIFSSFTPYVLEDIQMTAVGQTNKYGDGYFVFALYFVGFIAASFYNLLSKRKHMNAIQKKQTNLILAGFFISSLSAFTTNFVLTRITESATVSQYGPLMVVFFVAFSAYAILRHRLFNIKIIAAELLTFVIWFVLFMQTILAETIEAAVINGSLFVFVLVFGMFLIRGVIKEVEQGEKMRILSSKLERTNKELEELDKVKSQFLSFATHQVKTPMTAIKGYACLIYYNVDKLSRSKIEQMAGKMKLSTDRTISLVNNLLDLKKVEEGRMQYNFEKASLADLARGVVDDLRLIAQEKGLYLVFETPAYNGEAEIDIQKVREVIQNLVENAIKYTDRGWVRVEVKKVEEDIVVSVRDSGRGVSAKVLPHLFREYERGSAVTTAIQGTGLGLFIAKQIITDHHGKIWAESAGEQKGSMFAIRLPMEQPKV
jgi:signal transduction histidine kinase